MKGRCSYGDCHKRAKDNVLGFYVAEHLRRFLSDLTLRFSGGPRSGP
jgi:hypothetical protein